MNGNSDAIKPINVNSNRCAIGAIGNCVTSELIGLGTSVRFFSEVVRLLITSIARLRVRNLVYHIWIMGVLGTPAALLSLTFLTAVLVLELSFHLRLIVPQDVMVPSFTSLLMLRELGPVVTAMLLASRVGAAISSEIATLNSTRQLDALRLCGINLMEFLVVPRVCGCLIASIGLTVLATGGALVIAAFTTASKIGLTPPFFLGHLFLFSEPSDLVVCVIKGAIFGMIIPIVACYRGLNALSGSDGVGNAATRSVVHNSVLIILMDFLVSWLWYAV